jgi:iron complex outermembrane recepter protein
MVVTASRSEEELQTSSTSTSIVTLRELETRPTQTVDQSLRYMPGLAIRRTKGPADTTASTQLRGFSGAQHTLVLIDGQPLNNSYSADVSWSALPIDEVQSIEVVRGPFSSLYGGDAVGGVINVRTKPVEGRHLEVRGEYGSNDTARYSARYSERLFNRLGISLGYQRLQTGGYICRAGSVSASTGTGGADMVTGVVPTLTTSGSRTYQVGWAGENWFNQHAYRIKGEYTLGSATVITLQFVRMDYGYGYDGYHSNLRNAAGQMVDRGTYLFDDGGVIRKLTVTPVTLLPAGGGKQLEHLWNGSLQHNFSSRHYLRLEGGYYGTPEAPYITPGTGATDIGGPGSYTLGVRHSAHANAQYNRDARRHHLVAGTETRHAMASSSKFDMTDWTSWKSQQGQNYFILGRGINESAYVQDRIDLSDRLRVTMGGRYDYWKTYDGQSNSYTAAAPLLHYPDRSDSALSGKLALTYTLPGEWVARVSAGTSFHAPTIYDLYGTYTAFSGTIYGANPALAPEKVKSWEAGFRKRFGQRTDIDAAYFENYITGLIYSKTDLDSDPSGKTRLKVNAGEGRTRGFESSVNQRVLSWLTFRGAFTFQNPIITSNAASPASVGKVVLYVPRLVTSGQLIGTRGRWSGSIGGAYSGASFSLDTNGDTTKGVMGAYDPYFLMDATLGYQLNQRLQIYLSTDNLLNRTYYYYNLCPGRTVNAGLRLRL